MLSCKIIVRGLPYHVVAEVAAEVGANEQIEEPSVNVPGCAIYQQWMKSREISLCCHRK
jgi:hypothetical protein